MPNRVPPVAPDEPERLQDLLQYRVLDTQPELFFDNLANLAATICDAPMVVVTFVDSTRQWFKSSVGLHVTETPREIAFCAYTIVGHDLLVVNDTHSDPRFVENPLVTADPEIRFYAGAPLITPRGHAIGTIAVLDRAPRDLSPSQRNALKMLARDAIEHLEIRRRADDAAAALRAIVTASPRAIIAIDTAQRVTLWNDGAEKMFGYSASEVIAKRVPLIPEGDGDSFQSLIARLLKGEVVSDYQTRRRRKDGVVLDVVLFASPIRNDRGEIIGTLGMLDDVTERKSVDRRLVQLGTMVEASEDAIIGGTLDGFITAWNRGAERMYGYTAEEMIGRPVYAIYPPDRLAEGQHIRDTLTRGESIHNLETVRLKKNGETVDVSVTLSPVKDQDGKPVGVSHVSRDISGKKRAERELERSLSLTKATLEATADGIIALDVQGRIVGYNQKFAELWRVPLEILESGDTARGIEYVASQLKDPEYFLEKTRRYFAGEQLDPVDIIHFKDGRIFERYVHPHVVADETVGYVFSYRDITRRTQLEQQLRQSQKMEAVGQLAGGIAHDFNNLLNVIIGYTELTKMQLPPGDPLHANADHVMKAADRAAALTRQLLVFSRKQVPQLEVIDINKIVDNLSAMLRRLIGEDIELQISHETDKSCIKADPGQIEQVIMNLAINARDAMPKGGRLQLTTSPARMEEDNPRRLRSGEYMVLTVRDNGEGMSEEVKAHIFEPFFTTKQPGKGTGLGLATVYAIVNQSGGDIEVESAIGEGTTFRVYLPVARQGAAEKPDQASDQPVRGHQTILVVEDEENLRKLIMQALGELGYTMFEAQDGTEALAVVKQHGAKIDLLITDVVMPGMRGWELARRVTELTPRIKVLYMSGYTDDAILDPASLGNNAAFIQKPFTPTALAQKVQSFMGSSRRVEGLASK